jgi:hypothetical protein
MKPKKISHAKPRAKRPPGRIRRAIIRKRARLIRETLPYAGCVLAGAVVSWWLRDLLPLVAVASAAAGVAGVRMHEARGWHRSGGKAAMRHRRQWQGTASMGELSRKLGLTAVRENAAAMRPSFLGDTRWLPPEEAGIWIGTVKRDHR